MDVLERKIFYAFFSCLNGVFTALSALPNLSLIRETNDFKICPIRFILVVRDSDSVLKVAADAEQGQMVVMTASRSRSAALKAVIYAVLRKICCRYKEERGPRPCTVSNSAQLSKNYKIVNRNLSRTANAYSSLI
nr:hypothetical protein [Mixta theicola]